MPEGLRLCNLTKSRNKNKNNKKKIQRCRSASSLSSRLKIFRKTFVYTLSFHFNYNFASNIPRKVCLQLFLRFHHANLTWIFTSKGSKVIPRKVCLKDFIDDMAILTRKIFREKFVYIFKNLTRKNLPIKSWSFLTYGKVKLGSLAEIFCPPKGKTLKSSSWLIKGHLFAIFSDEFNASITMMSSIVVHLFAAFLLLCSAWAELPTRTLQASCALATNPIWLGSGVIKSKRIFPGFSANMIHQFQNLTCFLFCLSFKRKLNGKWIRF